MRYWMQFTLGLNCHKSTTLTVETCTAMRQKFLPVPSTRGLHFLAVQPDPDSEELNGLWLLQDRPAPNI